MDELFVRKDSKYHIIKEEDLGDTVAARLCGYENIEDAHLPRLKTLDFIKKLEGYYKESKKERAEKSADGRRNNKRDDNRRDAIEVDDDDDDEGSEDNDEEEDEEEEEEEEEDGIEDESTKEREINLQSDSTDTTTVTTTTEDGGDDSDSDSDNEGRRRRNTVSKKYTRMVRCIRRCGVPSATVNAKALRSSLARLAKSSTDRKTESATTITEEEEEEKEKESTDNPANKEKEEAERHEAVEPGDVVLRVTFYNKSSAKSQEFYVLGSQRLVELRDAIDCTVDHLERSNEANAGYEGQSQSASVKFFKSASFLIENVFYNDMRDSSNADYGKPVTVWAEKLRRRLHIKDGPSESSSSGILGPYKSEDMSKTRFSDLNIRLGVSYAYLHQADCEHRFVFSEIHLVSKGDDTNRLHYPLVAFKVKSNCKKCDVCRMFPGVLITYDDRYAPQVPAYWCMECYNRFHFGASGQKSYHYKALPYIYDFT